MRRLPEGCLKESFHLADIGLFAVQQLLTQDLQFSVFLAQLVEIPDPFHYAFCIAFDHQLGDFGGIYASFGLHSDHGIRHKPYGGIQFGKFPASLAGKGVGFCFNNVVFPKLGVEYISKWSAHACFQAASDTDLTHLGSFQNGREEVFAVFQVASPLSLCPSSSQPMRGKGTFSKNAHILSVRKEWCGCAESRVLLG